MWVVAEFLYHICLKGDDVVSERIVLGLNSLVGIVQLVEFAYLGLQSFDVAFFSLTKCSL